jgi:tetratricopeptide (TPR) repeat protein
MMSFASRCLPVLAISLLLSACQNTIAPYQAPVDETIAALRQLEQDIAADRLPQAEQQLQALRLRNPADTRLESHARQLAEAYMARGNTALTRGDLDQATAALAKARQLLPQAPALTSGLDSAIDQARQQQDAAEAEQRRAAAAAEAEAARRSEAVRQQQLAAARDAERLQAEASAAQAATTVTQQRTKRPRLIDPAATSSVVGLPMLDSQDNQALRNLMDAVAEDVVAYNCSVRIEVRQPKDFPWVAALLSARVKRLDPGFNPSMIQSLKPEQTPRLVLTPAP